MCLTQPSRPEEMWEELTSQFLATGRSQRQSLPGTICVRLLRCQAKTRRANLRAFEVIEAFTAPMEQLSLTELARRLDVDQRAVARQLRSLCAEGYVMVRRGSNHCWPKYVLTDQMVVGGYPFNSKCSTATMLSGPTSDERPPCRGADGRFLSRQRRCNERKHQNR
jgi:IclR helix-turn-helix domain